MAKDKITIYDIAEILSITPSTVSRALSNHPRISERTKKRVKKIAKELHYQHNGIAAALRSGKTHILGIIVPTTNRNFFTSVFHGIEQVANQAGYNLMITQSNDTIALEKLNIEALLKAQVDGIIASISKETTTFHHFESVMENNIPLILFDRVSENIGASTVVLDDYLGGYIATEHLIQQGCKRIAHFSGQQHLNIYKYRFKGYLGALEAYNIAFDPDLVVFKNQLNLEDGRQCMKPLLQLSHPPDAVFTASDYSAIGAMQVVKENGLSIPDDIALVGFANEPFTSFVEPGLTTINQWSEEMGQLAANLFLEEVLADDQVLMPRKKVLKPKLIIRGSSRKF